MSVLFAGAVRVVPRPQWDRRTLMHGDSALDLEPTEDVVAVRRVLDIAVTPTHQLGLSEPAVEEEDVARPDTLRLQVALGGTGLPEDGPPPLLAWKAFLSQVGVEVGFVFGAYLAACEVAHEGTQRKAARCNIGVPNGRVALTGPGYGKGA